MTFLQLLLWGASPIVKIMAEEKIITVAKTGFVFDEIYLDEWRKSTHPESPQRLMSIMQSMQSSGLLSKLKRLHPLDDVLESIALTHSTEHIESIMRLHPRSHPVAAAVVGGALAALDEICTGKIKNAFCAARPPGHHAHNSGREEGFCFYNTIAVAARYAQQVYGLKKILIADWDYHHGNGTEAFFYDDPSVLFFSTHDYHAYPGTGNPAKKGAGIGEGFNINVHLDCHADDADIMEAFETQLLPVAHRFQPDLILISAGFDSRKDDLLGCFDVSDAGYVKLTQLLMGLADQYCDSRILSILEGGYTPDGLASAVSAHLQALMG